VSSVGANAAPHILVTDSPRSHRSLALRARLLSCGSSAQPDSQLPWLFSPASEAYACRAATRGAGADPGPTRASADAKTHTQRVSPVSIALSLPNLRPVRGTIEHVLAPGGERKIEITGLPQPPVHGKHREPAAVRCRPMIPHRGEEPPPRPPKLLWQTAPGHPRDPGQPPRLWSLVRGSVASGGDSRTPIAISLCRARP
jgi:hypothetical protein